MSINRTALFVAAALGLAACGPAASEQGGSSGAEPAAAGQVSASFAGETVTLDALVDYEPDGISLVVRGGRSAMAGTPGAIITVVFPDDPGTHDLGPERGARVTLGLGDDFWSTEYEGASGSVDLAITATEMQATFSGIATVFLGVDDPIEFEGSFDVPRPQ